MMEEIFKSRAERVEELLKTRKERIEELREECENLLKLEQEWRKESNDIILNTNFKDLYGKDNEHVRNAHLQSELPGKFDDVEMGRDIVKFLEMEIVQIDKEIDTHKKIMSFINIVNSKEGV